MIDLIKESIFLGAIGSFGATAAIFVFQLVRRAL